VGQSQIKKTRVFSVLSFYSFFFTSPIMTTPPNPNSRAVEWIKRHWKTWQVQGGVFGPLTTFTTAGGLITYALVYGQHDKMVVAGSTAIGATLGYFTADFISQMVNGTDAGWLADQYGQCFTEYPFLSAVYVAGTGLVGLIIFQIFGGEIIDFIPGVDGLAIGMELAVGFGAGIVSLPLAITMFQKLQSTWDKTKKKGSFWYYVAHISLAALGPVGLLLSKWGL